MRPWKVILATMVIFACGVITGAIVTRTVETRTEPAAVAPVSTAPAPLATGARMPGLPVLQMQRANFLKMMDKQLELAAAQREQIAKILKASQERTQPLWAQISPQMTNELKTVREEIRDVLTPQQRKKFMELLKRNRKAEPGLPGHGQPEHSPDSTTNAAE